MENHSEQITVYKRQAISIRSGWAMPCPKCGKHVASGSDGVPKPLTATCFGDSKPNVLKANK